jgi:outer membrane receptor protein involved in Fe transport
MTKKNILFLILLGLFLHVPFLQAQKKSNQQKVTLIKGAFIDSLTQEGEPYATIRVFRKSRPKTPIKLAVTNQKGKFSEKINGLGEFVIQITSIGKNAVQKDFIISRNDKEKDLGTFWTQDATETLKNVEIIAQKPLVKVDVDKLEYNIKDDPDAKTNTVMEMLRKVPMVTVDGEDNIKVNGSSSFIIQINGRTNKMMSSNAKDIFKSMPASSIKKIEVITNPGAKYDAEGVGGVLNIVTSEKGLEGYSLTLNGGTSNRGMTGGVYSIVKKGKLTLSVNANYSHFDHPSDRSESLREQWNDAGNRSKLTSTSKNKHEGDFGYGNLEASYEIDSLRLISVSFGGYGGGHDGNMNATTIMKNAFFGPDADYSYTNVGINSSNWFALNGSVDYQRTSRKNKQRIFTLSYRIDTNSNNSETDNSIDCDDVQWADFLKLYNRKSDGSTSSTEHTFQADYTTPIGKMHTIETGVKYILRKNNSETDYFTDQSGAMAYDESNSIDYRHTNNILSAYAGYTLRYKKFGFKAGLRYEYTLQDVDYRKGRGEDFDFNYSNLVPSANISYKITPMQALRFSYNMRIQRPSIWYLNPYVNDMDPTRVRFGNPNLECEKGHSIGLNYSNFTQKLNINFGVNYNFGNNGIEEYSYLGDGSENIKNKQGVMYTTYGNVGRRRNVQSNLFVNWNATPLTRVYANAWGAYSDLRSTAMNVSNHGWSGGMYGGVQHTFPWKLRFSANIYTSSRDITLQGKGSGYTGYSFNLNRTFLKDRLTVSAYASDIFNSKKTFENETISTNFIDRSKYIAYRSRFGIRLSFRIGQLKAAVKKASRTIRNDDVMQGNSSGGSNTGGSQNGK